MSKVVFEKVSEKPWKWGYKAILNENAGKKELIIYEVKKNKEKPRLMLESDSENIKIRNIVFGLKFKGKVYPKNKAYIEVSKEMSKNESYKFPEFVQPFLNVKGDSNMTWAAITDGSTFADINYFGVGFEPVYVAHKELINEIAEIFDLKIRYITKTSIFGRHFG